METTRGKLVTDYKLEVLRYLLEVERDREPLANFLETSQIAPWMRDKLAQWLIDLSAEVKATAHTAQYAITVMNVFLKKVPTTNKNCLQLLGVVCLMIAIKTQDSLYYDLDRAVVDSARRYKKSDIITTELFVLKSLNWGLSFTTAAELSRQLIYITDVQYNFKDVIDKSDVLSNICYTDYRLSQFSPLTIALVSVQCALELIRQYRFRNEWLLFLHSKLELNLDDLNACKAGLVEKLIETLPDPHKLQTLSRESMEELLAQIKADRISN